MNSGPRAKRERFERLGRLFEELTGLDPFDRDRLIAARCADDALLAAEVRALLRADATSRDTGFVERLLATEVAAIAELPDGTSIGPWRVVRHLGGHTGRRSFLVDRQEDTGRMRAVLRTFPKCVGTSEAAITAFWRQFGRLRALSGEGLARILGAGVDPDGTPYVAVEVAEGERITTWCERRGVALPERLEMFVGVCAVIARAHAEGIAHGGLRASRIVVGPDGTPTLLDLGIASLGAACEGRGDPPSPRADVLALGRVLHELMTGTRPQDPGRPARPRRPVADRAAGEARPPALPTVADGDPAGGPREPADGPGASACGKPSEPAGGTPEPDVPTRLYLDSGVGAIVSRALRADPSLRYPAADAMAEDLRRHLRGLPVLVAFDEGAPPRRLAPAPSDWPRRG